MDAKLRQALRQAIRLWRKAVKDGETRGLTKRQFIKLLLFPREWRGTVTYGR